VLGVVVLAEIAEFGEIFLEVIAEHRDAREIIGRMPAVPLVRECPRLGPLFLPEIAAPDPNRSYEVDRFVLIKPVDCRAQLVWSSAGLEPGSESTGSTLASYSRALRMMKQAFSGFIQLDRLRPQGPRRRPHRCGAGGRRP